ETPQSLTLVVSLKHSEIVRSEFDRLTVSSSAAFGYNLLQISKWGVSMRTRMQFVLVLLLAMWAAGAIEAQITSNPIPAPITKHGIAVEIKELVRLPDTRGIRLASQDVSPAGWARVSYVRDLADGRRFANDSRGFLYLIGANNQPQVVYANVAAAFPNAVYNRLESGFIGFVFH